MQPGRLGIQIGFHGDAPVAAVLGPHVFCVGCGMVLGSLSFLLDPLENGLSATLSPPSMPVLEWSALQHAQSEQHLAALANIRR